MAAARPDPYFSSLPWAPARSDVTPAWKRLWELSLVRRLCFLAALFALELAVITIQLDNNALSAKTSLTVFLRDWGPSILRAMVLGPALFVTFACIRFPNQLADASAQIEAVPVRWSLFLLHAVALTLFGLLSRQLYGGELLVRRDLVAAAWVVSGVCAIIFGANAFVPPSFWRRLLGNTGHLWAIAIVATLSANSATNATRLLWPVATRTTFLIVQMLVRPFDVFTADPAAMTIGNHRFTVAIAPACSGLEGVGLVLAFMIVWLILFSRECRFPQALVLLPIGVAVAFLLNSVRIAALILIGDAGFQGVAAGGFHSQAGWIAFNVVALGLCLAAREVSWFSVLPSASSQKASRGSATVNPTVAWVAPFVTILAVGMISRSLSAKFEWLYGLRFVAAAIAIWACRKQYKRIDWHFDWTAPVAGLLVFAVWIGFDRSAAAPMPSQLATAAPALVFGWIVFRVLGGVVTVPIAEELAFRGFLMRRFIALEFEAVSFRRFSWLALIGSSVLFGLLHGQRWMVGTLAGAIYAATVLPRGRLANAIVAHAVTNALLAVEVLAFHRWDLW